MELNHFYGLEPHILNHYYTHITSFAKDPAVEEKKWRISESNR